MASLHTRSPLSRLSAAAARRRSAPESAPCTSSGGCAPERRLRSVPAPSGFRCVHLGDPPNSRKTAVRRLERGAGPPLTALPAHGCRVRSAPCWALTRDDWGGGLSRPPKISELTLDQPLLSRGAFDVHPGDPPGARCGVLEGHALHATPEHRAPEHRVLHATRRSAQCSGSTGTDYQDRTCV